MAVDFVGSDSSCGPFLFAPISELYGRQVAYLASLIPYVFFSLGTALSHK
jgi:DHA1 family multidrug resistance protein-like MFS transporter